MAQLDVEWLEVLPEEQWPYVNDDGQALRRLDGVGKVNIFVGPNNGGKSRLLRCLSRQGEFTFGAEQSKLNELRSWLAAKNTEINALWQAHSDLEAVHTIRRDSLRVDVPPTLSTKADSLAQLRQLSKDLETAGSGHAQTAVRSGYVGTRVSHGMLSQLRLIATELKSHLDGIPDARALAPKRKVYVPVLRGLRHLGREDVFSNRTKTEYFNPATAESPEVFTGLALYSDIRNHLLGPRDERQKIREYERYLARDIFDVSDVALIPRTDSDVLYVKIGEETERPIHDLGDGIQSVIILTYHLFTAKAAWFFMEEPELFLHPGFQRKILSLLLKGTHEHRTFLTTHSNHFLDMSLDYAGVAVYGVSKSHVEGHGDEKDPRFQVELLDSARDTALSLLGVRNSSVFLVNATVWVEGVTDRFYLRRLLELYQRSLPRNTWRADEDVHFSFVEYGGGNVVHFAFGARDDNPGINVRRLCGRAMVFADDDGGAKKARLDEMRTVLKERLVVLPAREIENLLPWSVVAKVVASYERVEASSLTEHDLASYRDTPLGEFIQSTVLGSEGRRRGGYAADSGTLKAKPDFCERALEHMTDTTLLEELSPETRDMLANLYQFIRKQNIDAVESHDRAQR